MPYCIGTTFHELLHTLTVTPTLSTALLSRGGARARGAKAPGLETTEVLEEAPALDKLHAWDGTPKLRGVLRASAQAGKKAQAALQGIDKKYKYQPPRRQIPSGNLAKYGPRSIGDQDLAAVTWSQTILSKHRSLQGLAWRAWFYLLRRQECQDPAFVPGLSAGLAAADEGHFDISDWLMVDAPFDTSSFIALMVDIGRLEPL
ncbi:hypothetical protein WJX84_002582 [Apatococcus fuscideae]|uniref:Uncharacterized protein n=1 Tax=Apatococcus fuscideae TaxID=2026836 RepID=A0AAW1SSY6_9CHLO